MAHRKFFLGLLLAMSSLLAPSAARDEFFDVEVDDSTPLMIAAKLGELDMVKMLLAVDDEGRPLFESEVNAKNNNGLTALMIAADFGHVNIVNALLTVTDIDINAQTLEGNTALFFAAMKNHEDVVKKLLAFPGIDVNAKNSAGSTALMFAAAHGYNGVVKELLAFDGIDVNIEKKHQGGTALNMAAANGHNDIVKLLIVFPGVKITAQDSMKYTPLMFAISNDHIDIVKTLLAVDDDGKALFEIGINAKNDKGYTALMLAATWGKLDIVEELLKVASIDVNIQNDEGYTALMLAAKNGHQKVARKLLEVPGIDINAQNHEGFTALMFACSLTTADCVKLLLSKSEINVDPINNYGDTALMCAISTGIVDDASPQRIDNSSLERIFNKMSLKAKDSINSFGENLKSLVLNRIPKYEDFIIFLIKSGFIVADDFPRKIKIPFRINKALTEKSKADAKSIRSVDLRDQAVADLAPGSTQPTKTSVRKGKKADTPALSAQGGSLPEVSVHFEAVPAQDDGLTSPSRKLKDILRSYLIMEELSSTKINLMKDLIIKALRLQVNDPLSVSYKRTVDLPNLNLRGIDLNLSHIVNVSFDLFESIPEVAAAAGPYSSINIEWKGGHLYQTIEKLISSELVTKNPAIFAEENPKIIDGLAEFKLLDTTTGKYFIKTTFPQTWTIQDVFVAITTGRNITPKKAQDDLATTSRSLVKRDFTEYIVTYKKPSEEDDTIIKIVYDTSQKKLVTAYPIRP